MSRLPAIRKLEEGAAGFGFFLCARKELRSGGRGGDVLALILEDATGQIQARMSGDISAAKEEFDAGEFVKVHATVRRFNQKLELAIERIRRVDAVHDRLDGFREEDCTARAPRPLDEMWGELEACVSAVADIWLRRLLERAIERHGDRLRIWPAALVVHHAYRGGLLEHILQMASVGRAVAAAYGADADLVVAGAILHDVGKLEELAYEGATAYTRRGNLVGHIMLGAQMVRELAASIDGFPEGLLARVEHMIVSHHGARELGSPVEPMTEEALVLSAIDALDAHLHQFRRHVADDAGDGEFTSYHPRLRRVLLKPSVR